MQPSMGYQGSTPDPDLVQQEPLTCFAHLLQVGIAEVEMEEDSAAEGSQGDEEEGHATAKPVSSK